MSKTEHTQNDSNQEELEGFEQGELSMAEYPIDSVLIRSDHRTVYDVCRRIDKKQFILDPDFQRDFVWKADKQSRLIESVLMRIPLPVFYLAEQSDGRIIVVDGLQRLTTLHRYINNKFSLTHLDNSNSQLLRKKFKNLHPKLQNRIEDTNLVLYLIDEKVPERAKLDIFERVNAGVTLTRQQMRNCLYMGSSTRWLKKAANAKEFINATTSSLPKNTMRDRELINRFCAFHVLGPDEYGGYMEDFLANTLIRMNKYQDESPFYEELHERFCRSMTNNNIVFGNYAFRRHYNRTDRRSVINASLFDVFSVAFANITSNTAKQNKKLFQEKFYNLMGDRNFVDAITYSTNSTSRIATRFRIINEEFKEYFDA